MQPHSLGGSAVTPLERLEQAWIQAGYPKEHLPKQQFVKVAPFVAEAYDAGVADFLKAGWAQAKVDYPFAPSHPRYQAMVEAYRELS
jgi:hypothetical protein